MIFGQRQRQEARQRREVLRQEAAAAGWAWEDATPAPIFEFGEAALRGSRYNDIWMIGVADAVQGTVRGREFQAGRLVGYEYGMTNSGIPHGDLRETNAVWISLPASLPEIRLVDTTSSDKDAGLSLPVMSPPRTADGRWQVEGFVPAFATDLLQPPFVAALSTAPSVTAIVIRAGFVLAYGTRAHDASTIGHVADSLAAVVDAVPPTAWGRADALVAGFGVFPRRTVGGAELRLEQRLVRPDWKGYGLGAKVPWQQAPDAPKHVTMSRREAVDVWDVQPGTPSGIYIGKQAGGSEVPTVASTMHHGTNDI